MHALGMRERLGRTDRACRTTPRLLPSLLRCAVHPPFAPAQVAVRAQQTAARVRRFKRIAMVGDPTARK